MIKNGIIFWLIAIFITLGLFIFVIYYGNSQTKKPKTETVNTIKSERDSLISVRDWWAKAWDQEVNQALDSLRRTPKMIEISNKYNYYSGMVQYARNVFVRDSLKMKGETK